MPNSVGVYGIPDVRDAGDEVSSTYEGRHITMLEGELIHPIATPATGFVVKGSPVVLTLYNAYGTPGKAVGVALASATVITDRIAVDTEGIWALTVYGENDLGNSRVTAGDPLYIDYATNQVIAAGVGYGGISKISNGATNIPFGYALGDVAAGGSGVIAVKVHFDPSQDNAKRTWYTAADGAYTYGKHYTTVFEGGQSTGLEYHDQRVTGAQSGNIYGWGTWMELAALFVPDGSLIVGHEIGIYDVGCDLAGNNGRVVMQQMQAQLASVPGTSFHWWRMNLDAAGGTATALIAAANPASVGLVVAGVAAAATIGGLPLVEQGGVVYFVRLYATAS